VYCRQMVRADKRSNSQLQGNSHFPESVAPRVPARDQLQTTSPYLGKKLQERVELKPRCNLQLRTEIQSRLRLLSLLGQHPHYSFRQL